MKSGTFMFFKLLTIFLILTSECFNCYSKILNSNTFRRSSKNKRTLHTNKFNRSFTSGGDDDEDFEVEDREMPIQLQIFINEYKFLDGFHPNQQIQEQQPNEDLESCNQGFGFIGVIHEDMRRKLRGPLEGRFYSRLITPVYDKLAGYFEFKGAYGDFTGADITQIGGSLSSFSCDVIPINPLETYGVIGYSGEKAPCGTEGDSHLKMCIIFDRCGTVAISTDGKSLKCAADFTNLGQTLLSAENYVTNTSFGISLVKKFPKQLTLGKIKGMNFEYSTYEHFGNFFFFINGRLPPLKYKIGEKPIEDIIKIYNGEGSVYVGAGKKEVEEVMQDIENNYQGIFEKITNIGVEFAFSYKNGEISLFLDEITNGIFPDIFLKVSSLDFLISTGSGPSGLPFGIYATLSANHIYNLRETQIKIFDHFSAILGIMGYKEELSQRDDLQGAIEISVEGIGFELSGHNLKYKCLLVYDGFRVSCQFGKMIFTALLVMTTAGLMWVIKKVSKLLEETGEKILKFVAKAKEFSKKAAEALTRTFKQKFDDFFKKSVKKFKEGLEVTSEVVIKMRMFQ